jgi:DNA-binding NarL/FixJ family response regulator
MKQPLSVNIFIVDDNAFIRERVKFQLKLLGYNVVVEAENGREFLDKLDTDTTPDICVMDINMPIMDGLETTARLKKIRPAIKVIFFSSEDSSEFAPKGLALGAEGFIAKDAPFAELNDLLLSVMNQPQQRVA